MDNRNLATGVQDFKKLIEDKYIYVDKTDYVYKLASSSRPIFLFRPRRFGKSLFLSTLRYFFESQKELFKGLKIYDLEKEWTEYPVFYIDLNIDSYIDINSFYAALESNLSIDGYKFSHKSERLYNPYSLLRTLLEQFFKFYWFETGTPTFVTKILQQQNYDIRNFED